MSKDLIVKHEGDIESLKTDMKNIYTTLDRIENNHLDHIQKAIEAVQKGLDEVKVKLAENKPVFRIAWKTIELVVLGVAAAVIGLVIATRI